MADIALFADVELAGIVRSLTDQPLMFASGDIAALCRANDERVAHRPPEPDMSTVDVDMGKGRCQGRLSRPGAFASDVVVFLHGGGWTVGGVESRSGAVVVAVDY